MTELVPNVRRNRLVQARILGGVVPDLAGVVAEGPRELVAATVIAPRVALTATSSLALDPAKRRIRTQNVNSDHWTSRERFGIIACSVKRACWCRFGWLKGKGCSTS